MRNDKIAQKSLLKVDSQETISLDYSNLQADIQILIQERTYEIKDLIGRTANNIIEIGHKLHEVKQILGHGNFGNWLKAEFNWSVATATKMMQASQQFKNVNFTNLSFSPSAVYLLAAPSTPEPARREALARAKQGQPITYSLAKKLVNHHKYLTASSGPEQNISDTNLQKNPIKLEPEQLPVATSQQQLNLELLPTLNSRVEPNFFKQYLVREWLRMKREREFFSVILCMVDNFLIKKDKLSETQIKKLLKIVAQGIGKSINRPTDAFTDYQPGQFLVLLSNTSPEGVKKIAKTIETNINDCQETWIQSITVSVRILSLIPSPQDTLKKIMASLTSSITPGSSPEEN